MNFAPSENGNSRQPYRQWTPIITQQLRLRHVSQIIAYNLVNNAMADGFHYTLHSTAMSAPFYTSEAICGYCPKWKEFDLNDLQVLTSSGFVLRIWQSSQILLTWGIHLSGMVYLGTQLSDIRPEQFLKNTVIIQMRGGYFTSGVHLRIDRTHALPCIDAVNMLSTADETKLYKLVSIKMPLCDVRKTYDLTRLKQMQSMQIRIRNQNLRIYHARTQIEAMLNPSGSTSGSVSPSHLRDEDTGTAVRYAPQLLTMTHLNKMMNEKPSGKQKCEIARLHKAIEVSRLRNKMLKQERDRKCGELRALSERFNEHCDENAEHNSKLMEDYRALSKDIERLREWKKEYIVQREQLHQLTKQLQLRRRQLMNELLHLYPIRSVADKYYINDVHLPHSDLLYDAADAGLSVALGYCAHVLVMCASFLQIPLRYPVQHLGSRSVIEDHVHPHSDKCREFPLFTRGKDRIHFNNAVYLLNKNIAQYLHALGFKPQELRTTLPNLAILLRSNKESAAAAAAAVPRSGPPLESSSAALRARPGRPMHMLAIPEAVLSRHMTSDAFLAYMRSDLGTPLPGTSSASSASDYESQHTITSCDNVRGVDAEEHA